VRNGFVAAMAAQFAAQSKLLLVLAPEGTRALTAGWKSGFYRIALTANVPLALGFVDYARRQAGILAYLTLSGRCRIPWAIFSPGSRCNSTTRCRRVTGSLLTT